MDDIIILVDENGEEQEYEVLDTVEYEGERYVVLIQEDDDEVSVLKIESEDGDDLELVVCEDDVIEIKRGRRLQLLAEGVFFLRFENL